MYVCTYNHVHMYVLTSTTAWLPSSSCDPFPWLLFSLLILNRENKMAVKLIECNISIKTPLG